MAVILENKALTDNTYRMVARMDDGQSIGSAGQFCMLSPSESSDPLLGRPICVYDNDADAHTVTFIYVTLGRGTSMFPKLKAGDTMRVNGPLGKGFPIPDRDIILVGGGVGAAPLHMLAKQHKALYPHRKRTMYVGFRTEGDVLLMDDFRAVCDEVVLNIGGYVTDDVDFTRDDAVYFACGTMPMMGAAAKLAIKSGRKMYLSLEKHMACGVGACLVCTCETKDGTRKRVCKDGPVFLADDVYDAEKGCFYE